MLSVQVLKEFFHLFLSFFLPTCALRGTFIVSSFTLFRCFSPLSPLRPPSNDWSYPLTESVLDPRRYPRGLLSSSEIAFVSELLPNPLGSPQPVFTSNDLAVLLLRHFRSLVGNIALTSLSRNLLSGETYTDSEYFDSTGVKKGELFLFRKGLVRAYPFPASRAKFQYWYGFPRENYRLVPSNFRAKFPPHDAFSSWCMSALTRGLSGTTLIDVSDRYRVVPHWDGSGNYISDFVLKIRLPDGEDSFWWFEIHTGSEGYDYDYFLKRLVTMERFLAFRNQSFFIMLVPFIRDLTLAEESIRRYNKEVETNQLLDLPYLDLKKSRLLAYKQIDSLRGEFGSETHSEGKLFFDNWHDTYPMPLTILGNTINYYFNEHNSGDMYTITYWGSHHFYIW